MRLCRYFPIFITAALASYCAPIKKRSTDLGAIEPAPRQTDNQSPTVLKVAYSIDDITAVEIVPKKLQVQPWQPVRLFLAGTLPDKTQGRIPHEVEWSVDDPAIAMIGPKSGELIALREGLITVSSKFRKLSSTKSIKVRWLANHQDELPEPVDFDAYALDEASIHVSWNFGEGPVGSHQIAYQQGAVPTSCDETNDQVKVIDTATIRDLTEIEIKGLAAATEYGIRLCAVQELTTDGLTARRFSPGLTGLVVTAGP